MKKVPKTQIDNIIRVSKRTDDAKIAWSLLLRTQPLIYNQYGCIKIRATENYLGQIENIVAMYGDLLTIIEKRPVRIQVNKGVILDRAFELIVQKTGTLAQAYDEDKEEVVH